MPTSLDRGGRVMITPPSEAVAAPRTTLAQSVAAMKAKALRVPNISFELRKRRSGRG